MGGFAAISSGNGWLISMLGISVVFFALAALAFIISYFPRVINWWNDHAKTPRHVIPLVSGLFGQRRRKVAAFLGGGEIHEPGEIDDAEEALRLLTAHMGEPFMLPRLIEIADQRGLAKVHSMINRLILRGTMVGGADGLFRWAKGSEKERQVENKFRESE
jgi:hypothetical protein